MYKHVACKHNRKVNNTNVKGIQKQKITMRNPHKEGTKLVKLLPGVALNGYSTHTITRPKALRKKPYMPQNVDDLTNNGNGYPQHSKKKRKSCQCSDNSSPTSSGVGYPLQDNQNFEPLNFESPTTIYSENPNFKSILKNKSKSIFKEINDRVAMMNQRTKEDHTSVYVADTAIDMEYPTQLIDKKPKHLISNRSVNEYFARNVRVAFKTDLLQMYVNNIKQEIANVNLALQGRADILEMGLRHNMEENRDNLEKNNKIPAKQWVYNTPRNRKINRVPSEGRKLESALIYRQNHHFHVEDRCNRLLRPTSHIVINNEKFRDTSCSPDNIDVQQENRRVQYNREHLYKNNKGNYFFHHPQGTKLEMPCENPPQSINTADPEITFIADGSEFKLQQTQKGSNEFYLDLNCESANMVNFYKPKPFNCGLM